MKSKTTQEKDGLDNLINPRRNLKFRTSLSLTYLPSSLSEAEEKLLSKGLNFCPTPTVVNQVEVSQNLTEYYRRLRQREFVLDLLPSDPESFRCKITWVPAKNRVPSLETYIQVVSSKINSSDHSLHRTHDNHPRENVRHSSLSSRKDIIIKPANKGSEVVVMGRHQYIDEAMRQLTNRTNYETLDSDPTGNFCKEIQETLDDMRDNITFLRRLTNFSLPQIAEQPDSTFCLRFTNPANPRRPIISGNGSPTEHISLFVDSFLKPH